MGVRTLGNDSQYKLSFEIILIMQSYRMFSINPVLVVLSIVTCTAISAPVQTPLVEAAYNVISVNDSVPTEASVVDVLNSSSNWLSMFKIKEMMECYQLHGLDPFSLPTINNISTELKFTIFDSCDPFFYVPFIGIKANQYVIHQERVKKSPPPRPGKSRASTPIPSIPTYSPIVNVNVMLNGLDLVNEVLRLQFLFLTTFFSGLSGCIETEGIENSVCLLQSLSNAFATLTLELEEQE